MAFRRREDWFCNVGCEKGLTTNQLISLEAKGKRTPTPLPLCGWRQRFRRRGPLALSPSSRYTPCVYGAHTVRPLHSATPLRRRPRERAQVRPWITVPDIMKRGWGSMARDFTSLFPVLSLCLRHEPAR